MREKKPCFFIFFSYLGMFKLLVCFTSHYYFLEPASGEPTQFMSYVSVFLLTQLGSWIYLWFFTMACDMPNFDEKIDSVDYKSLKLLGHGATTSQYVDKVKLVNEEEDHVEVKALLPGEYEGDSSLKPPFERICLTFTFSIRIVANRKASRVPFNGLTWQWKNFPTIWRCTLR